MCHIWSIMFASKEIPILTVIIKYYIQKLCTVNIYIPAYLGWCHITANFQRNLLNILHISWVMFRPQLVCTVSTLASCSGDFTMIFVLSLPPYLNLSHITLLGWRHAGSQHALGSSLHPPGPEYSLHNQESLRCCHQTGPPRRSTPSTHHASQLERHDHCQLLSWCAL